MDIDFNNAAGFLGVPAKTTEAQYIVRMRVWMSIIEKKYFFGPHFGWHYCTGYDAFN